MASESMLIYACILDIKAVSRTRIQVWPRLFAQSYYKSTCFIVTTACFCAMLLAQVQDVKTERGKNRHVFHFLEMRRGSETKWPI
jgi:hypothetical protein